MKQIRKTIHSKTGATVVIAMIFMLICVFVGGSVLAAATVNSGRLSGRRVEQQALLNQRSILSAFVRQLGDESGDLALSMQIVDGAPIRPLISETPSFPDAVKYLIYTAEAQVFAGDDDARIDFTVTDPGDSSSVINCFVQCAGKHCMFIRFVDSPEVQLRLSSYSSDMTVTWYEAKIIKDGVAA